jgi:hypothetical protein
MTTTMMRSTTVVTHGLAMISASILVENATTLTMTGMLNDLKLSG